MQQGCRVGIAGVPPPPPDPVVAGIPIPGDLGPTIHTSNMAIPPYPGIHGSTIPPTNMAIPSYPGIHGSTIPPTNMAIPPDPGIHGSAIPLTNMAIPPHPGIHGSAIPPTNMAIPPYPGIHGSTIFVFKSQFHVWNVKVEVVNHPRGGIVSFCLISEGRIEQALPFQPPPCTPTPRKSGCAHVPGTR